MIKTILKIIVIVVVLSALAFPIIYLVGIYEMGHNFVHDKPASPEYYEHVQNRISFSANYRGEKLDSLLSKYLQNNPQYFLSDSIIQTNLSETTTCDCDCLPFRRQIYFASKPKEVYLVTFDYGYIQGGIIDIVYSNINNLWICTKSSKFDSTEKARIENRFETEIIKNLSN